MALKSGPALWKCLVTLVLLKVSQKSFSNLIIITRCINWPVRKMSARVGAVQVPELEQCHQVHAKDSSCSGSYAAATRSPKLFRRPWRRFMRRSVPNWTCHAGTESADRLFPPGRTETELATRLTDGRIPSWADHSIYHGGVGWFWIECYRTLRNTQKVMLK